ncbi:hypothetical protein F4810DRAFT_709944 [Camillea tinctor]|nr:hypothetical protein F4810DRAFT_709944 [Camillea tinctor]
MIDRIKNTAVPGSGLTSDRGSTLDGHVIVDDKEVFVHDAPQAYERNPPGLEPIPQAPGVTYQEYYTPPVPYHHAGSAAADPASVYADSADPGSPHIVEKPHGSLQEVRRYKKRFWWACIIGVLVVAALAIGIGVGISVSGSSDGRQDSGSDAAPSSNASQMTTSFSSSPVTTSSTTATYATLQSPSGILTSYGTFLECPGANGTVFVDPDTKLRFLRLCQTDYPVSSGNPDIRQMNATSMEECMTACASTKDESPSCTTVTWLWGPQAVSNNYCWLKSGGGKDPGSTDIAESAVLLED